MTNQKNPTKRENFNALLGLDAVQANQQLVDFINHELELLDRKNANKGDKKMTPQQVVNEIIKDTVCDILEANRLYTVTEILKTLGDDNVSNQRMTQLLGQLVKEDRIVKTIEKRKSYYSLPNA